MKIIAAVLLILVVTPVFGAVWLKMHSFIITVPVTTNQTQALLEARAKLYELIIGTKPEAAENDFFRWGLKEYIGLYSLPEWDRKGKTFTLRLSTIFVEYLYKEIIEEDKGKIVINPKFVYFTSWGLSKETGRLVQKRAQAEEAARSYGQIYARYYIPNLMDRVDENWRDRGAEAVVGIRQASTSSIFLKQGDRIVCLMLMQVPGSVVTGTVVSIGEIVSSRRVFSVRGLTRPEELFRKLEEVGK